MRFATSLALAALLLATSAVAQASPVDPDAVLVEELVVTALLPGPAWWRVSDADTVVYVLGAPSIMPKSLAWDQSVLTRRLQGANRVILPFNQVSVGLFSAPGAAINLLRLRSKTPYEATLPAALKARFVAVRTGSGKPPERYATKNGLAAGLILVDDYRQASQLTAADPAKTVRRLAKGRRIRVEEKSYDAGGLLGQVVRTPAAAQQACLEDALDEAEAGPAAARRAAEAWAQGDVRGALTAERGFEKCLASAPGALALDRRFKADQAAAIARALKTPGHAVAVVPLRPLLAQGGVLDQLQSQGFEVKTPGED
ncbi:MAG: TraB/GumN family protein [Phenylobacterium sp.]|uniref:TraB/GumN family protein n=1 Tax=Phenylobacterium sp. TaxID=1871053 RepID=UPI0027312C78|nr:TraB/GumN family protein [Phenylobacterium sp.]MDP2011171.1 TraB/GumN family protein [Phenylobacterium sp.]